MHKRKTIARDISWLSFNDRVLQEAADETVPLRERIRFLGIFSNNLDEFFRVRVATLRRMIELGSKAKMHLELKPEMILQEIEEKDDMARKRHLAEIARRDKLPWYLLDE